MMDSSLTRHVVAFSNIRPVPHSKPGKSCTTVHPEVDPGQKGSKKKRAFKLKYKSESKPQAGPESAPRNNQPSVLQDVQNKDGEPRQADHILDNTEPAVFL